MLTPSCATNLHGSDVKAPPPLMVYTSAGTVVPNLTASKTSLRQALVRSQWDGERVVGDEQP
jgi:hypothetical protein